MPRLRCKFGKMLDNPRYPIWPANASRQFGESQKGTHEGSAVNGRRRIPHAAATDRLSMAMLAFWKLSSTPMQVPCGSQALSLE